MSIRVDFSNVESFEPIPAGVYPATVVNQELRQSKDSEYDYINWELEISSGPFENRKLWTITSLSPKAVWKLQETLLAFGISDQEAKSPEFEFEPGEFLGSECQAAVIQESYNGRIQNRVEKLLPRELKKVEQKAVKSGPAPGISGERRRPPKIS